MILKPHVAAVPYITKDIQDRILGNKFLIIRTKNQKISTEEAHKFYDEHKEKFFFNRLVTFMCSGPSILHILAREKAIQTWRDMMGPTKVFKTVHSHPDTIRGLYGLSDTRNATHGSDSPQSAEREMKILFPDFNYSKWFSKEEEKYLNGQYYFNTEEFIHKLKN